MSAYDFFTTALYVWGMNYWDAIDETLASCPEANYRQLVALYGRG